MIQSRSSKARALGAEIQEDPIARLCALVREAGLTMTLYGKPVTEGELRGVAAQLAAERRLLASIDAEWLKIIDEAP